jgi:putative addiction module component (TIGR02574 family)
VTTLTPELIQQGLQLPPDERERFANLLLDSLEGPEADEETVRREWQEEIQRRWDRYESGEEQAIPIEDFLAELRQRIDAGKQR